jgi:hypothetical protein
VGIDKEDNNHLKRQWTTGADGPEAAVESWPPAPMVSMRLLCEFFFFNFAKNLAGEQRSLSGKVFSPPKELVRTRF